MAFPRRLEPEWLDVLPTDDPQAIGSRRDLRLVNRIMLNVPGVARALRASVISGGSPRSLLELGSGDGTWMLALAKKLAPHWPDMRVTLLDRQNVVDGKTHRDYERIGWKAETVIGDVFACLEGGKIPPHDIVVANLFLHHFTQEDLSRIFLALAPMTKLVIACEPRRSRLPLFMSHLLWLIGCNRTTQHDAVVSVRAGFTGNELSQCWPGTDAWTLEERATFPFSHCFVARHV